jgi:rod shape determining protein RodA
MIPPPTRLDSINIRVFNWRNVFRTDPLLSLLLLGLAIFGLLVLYSAGRSVSAPVPHFVKQSIFFCAGWCIALFIACIDYRVLISLAPLAYGIILSLLVAVLVVGEEIKGSRRWIDLGPVGFQPSESTKLVMVLFLAWLLTRMGRRVKRFPFLMLTFGAVAVPALLIFKQPDLGTAAVLGPISVAMLYAAGCKTRHLIVIALVGLMGLPVVWANMKEYQKQRVMTVINPSADPQGTGYHTIQSKITVGSGGLSGKGYTRGTQTYLNYLPEHHTDFIFSVMAEEFGFFGGLTALLLFLGFFTRALYIGMMADDLGGTLIVVGVVSLLAFHAFINISITIGMLPVTGIPLPFFSYGGSFYLTTMSCFGLILSVNARRGSLGFLSRSPALVPVR